MADLSDLIARVEAASGPDRRLDVDICVATAVICDSVKPDEVSNLRLDPDDAGWVLYDCDGSECADTAPEFTASIDAALTLLPEGYVVNGLTIWPTEGCSVKVLGTHLKSDGRHWHGSADGHWGGEGPTAPLTLLSAILKARQAAGDPS